MIVIIKINSQEIALVVAEYRIDASCDFPFKVARNDIVGNWWIQAMAEICKLVVA